MNCKLLEIISRNSNIIYRLLKYSFKTWKRQEAFNKLIEEKRQTYCGISARIILFFLSYINNYNLSINYQLTLDNYYKNVREIMSIDKTYEYLIDLLEKNRLKRNKYIYYFINIPESINNSIVDDTTNYFPGHTFLIEQFNDEYKIYQSYMLKYELSSCPNFNNIFDFNSLMNLIRPLENILGGLTTGQWNETTVQNWKNLTGVEYKQFKIWVERVRPSYIQDEKCKLGMLILEKDVCQKKYKNMSSNLENICYKQLEPFLNNWINMVSYHIRRNEKKILNTKFGNEFLNLNSNSEKSNFLKKNYEREYYLPGENYAHFYIYFTRSFQLIKINNYELIDNLLNIRDEINKHKINLNCNLEGGYIKKIIRYKINYKF